jgi:PST family polysaccharide transporter
MILLSISGGGIRNGMTKHIAQFAGSQNKLRLFLSTGFWITFTLSAICGLVLILGAGYFSRSILKDSQYISIFYIFGITIILYALNDLLISIINGFREFKKYVAVNISGSIVGLIFTIALSYAFGVYGALVSLVTYQSVVFLITLVMVARSPWFQWKAFFGRFSKTAGIRLWSYSKMAIATAVVLPLSQWIVRNYIITHQSKHNAGLWESMNRISNIYLMVITTSLSVYYLPKLASLKNDREIRSEIMSVYKLLLPALVLFSITLILCRYYIINILFSNDFQGMQNLFAFQLLGDLLKMATWVLGYVLVAKAMTKAYIIIEIVSCTLFVLFSIFFIDQFGTIGATIGYAAAFLCQLLVMVFTFRKLLFSHE